MSNVATSSCFVRPESRSKPLGPMKGEKSAILAILENLLIGEDFNKHFVSVSKDSKVSVAPDGTISVGHRRVQLDPLLIHRQCNMTLGKESQHVKHFAQKFLVKTIPLPLESCCNFGYCCRNCSTLIFFGFDHFSGISAFVELYFLTKVVWRFKGEVGCF